MNTIDAAGVTFERAANGKTTMRQALGKAYENVLFVQLFPHSDPRRYISVRHNDAEPAEIGIIEDASELPQDVQALIFEDIRSRYFFPEIKNILWVKTRRGADTWSVETDRGPTTFTVRERGENVTATDKGFVVITDTDTCRYKIEDFHALSPRSQTILEKVLL